MDILKTIWLGLQPYALEIIGMIVAAVIARAAGFAKAKFGLDIEARHREALHSALMTGIRAALIKNPGGGEAVISEAIAYASRSVPDAMAALNPDGAVIELLARSKLQQILK